MAFLQINRQNPSNQGGVSRKMNRQIVGKLSAHKIRILRIDLLHKDIHGLSLKTGTDLL